MTLTAAQRAIIDRARVLADLDDVDAICEYTGHAEPAAYAAAFTEAQYLLRELAIIALRQATST